VFCTSTRVGRSHPCTTPFPSLPPKVRPRNSSSVLSRHGDRTGQDDTRRLVLVSCTSRADGLSLSSLSVLFPHTKRGGAAVFSLPQTNRSPVGRRGGGTPRPAPPNESSFISHGPRGWLVSGVGEFLASDGHVRYCTEPHVVRDNYLSTYIPTVKMSKTHCSFHVPHVPDVLNRTWYRTIIFLPLFLQ
jgi:hypothetical protein